MFAFMKLLKGFPDLLQVVNCLWGVGKEVDGEEEGGCKQEDQGLAQSRERLDQSRQGFDQTNQGLDQTREGHPKPELWPSGPELHITSHEITSISVYHQHRFQTIF